MLFWSVIGTRQYVDYLRWAEGDEVVMMRSGWIWQQTTLARVNKIQAVAMHQSPFDRRAAMARVRVDTAGAGEFSHRVDIPYLDHQSPAAWPSVCRCLRRTPRSGGEPWHLYEDLASASSWRRVFFGTRKRWVTNCLSRLAGRKRSSTCLLKGTPWCSEPLEAARLLWRSSERSILQILRPTTEVGVPLVTFNKCLVSYLRAMAGGFPGSVDVRNYHHFARGYLHARGFNPSGKICQLETRRMLVKRAVAAVRR